MGGCAVSTGPSCAHVWAIGAGICSAQKVRRLRQLLRSRQRTRKPHELIFIALIYRLRLTLSRECAAVCAGTQPLRSLLGKRARAHDGDESADDLFRCTSVRSDVSEASHYSGEGAAAGGGGFVTPNTPIQVPACVAWAPRGPGLAGAAPPAPDPYGWEADGCRTPDQPIPAPSGPPPAPSRRDRARPPLRGGERPGLPALQGRAAQLWQGVARSGTVPVITGETFLSSSCVRAGLCAAHGLRA
jgi:hypothetical protein